MERLLGIDIGVYKTTITLGIDRGDGNVVIADKLIIDTEAQRGPAYCLNKIFDNSNRLLANNRLSSISLCAVGLSCSGVLDCKKGILLTASNMPGWENTPIAAVAESRLRTKAYLQNDANSCALAEWKFGNGKPYHDMVCLTFNYGMGAGLILNNRLYTGHSFMAGEIGHIRLERIGPSGNGKIGSFEGFCSDSGIKQLAQTIVLERLQAGKKVSFCSSVELLQSFSGWDVFEACKRGDEVARHIVGIIANYLGRGIATMIDMLNPEAVIIGGIFNQYSDVLMEPLMETIRSEALERSAEACVILPTGLGDKMCDYSALAVAYNAIHE